MMRQYLFHLDESQTNWAFSAIRTKYDYCKLLLLATKVMLTPTFLAEELRRAALVLHIEKMSRLFFAREGKIFSVNFPFITTQHADSTLTFRSHHHPSVDHRATSIALGLLTEAQRRPNNVLDFATSIDEANQTDPHAWDLLLELLTLEDGYLRYDDDPGSCNGHIHPRHHIDVFYTSQSTFKLGLSGIFTQPEFADLLNTLTNCRYLANPPA